MTPPAVRDRCRRVLTTVIPVVVPLAMQGVFSTTVRRFGPRRGYQGGFAVYWATCWLVALAVAGPRRLVALWRAPVGPLAGSDAMAVAAMAVPPVGAVLTQWLPQARRAGPIAVAAAAAVGVTNAMAEEALWRALPVAVFRSDPVRGWLWPAAGFTAWHLVPLAARHTGPTRALGVLAGAALIGLANGRVAQRSGSMALVSVAHALTDSCGVRVASEVWLRSESRDLASASLRVAGPRLWPGLSPGGPRC